MSVVTTSKFLIAWLLVWAAVATAGPAIISPSDSKLLFTGRVDFSKKTAPRLSWPGSSIKANFSGSYLELMLDDQLGRNYFNVIVDDNWVHPYVLEAKAGEHSYVISSVLAEGEHSLEIYKRTEGEEGSTAFKGIRLAKGGRLLAPPERPKRRMEIYGDSISSGMGNEAADNGADHLLSEKNNYWAYGSIAARALNAELHTISQSGIGIMISWFPFIMPQFFDQLSAVGDNNSQWDFSQWTPDVVVVNLFQNDSWLVDRDQKLQPVPTDEQRISSYIAFVKKLQGKYPKAYFICALGSMDATGSEKWPNYIREAVARIKKKDKNVKMDTLFFEFTGYGQHPRIAQHKSNAEILVKLIREKMNW